MKPECVNVLSTDPSGRIIAGTYDGVFSSEYEEDNWMSLGLTGIGILSLIATRSADIFAGTHYGVYRYSTVSHNWREVNSGLADSVILSLAINSEGYIFAGTLRGGVFRSLWPTVMASTKPTLVPSEFVLHQPYPNPFNPTTTLRYDLPRTVHVSLTIYDLLGREVAQLVSGRMVSGRYEVVWDATDVPTGIYFVRMVSGDFSQVRKVMVLK